MTPEQIAQLIAICPFWKQLINGAQFAGALAAITTINQTELDLIQNTPELRAASAAMATKYHDWQIEMEQDYFSFAVLVSKYKWAKKSDG